MTPEPIPLLTGSEAYRWAWLRHGPLLPYVRAGTMEAFLGDRYPRTMRGWAWGRLTTRAASVWARSVDPTTLAEAERQAILDAEGRLVPATCDACHGIADPTAPCVECFGTGLIHWDQPPAALRLLP